MCPGHAPQQDWCIDRLHPATGARIEERPEVPVLDPINLDAAAEPGIAPAVAAVGLARRYGQGATSVDALRGVDLDIEAGEMVAVMGPSGSGKSTLMHLLAGLDRPTTGTVIVAGKDITRLGEKALTRLRRDRIGFVFQGFNLLPTLTARRTSPCRSGSPVAPARPIRRASSTCSTASASPIGVATGPPSSPADSSSASPSPGRSSPSRPSCSPIEPTGNLDSRSSGRGAAAPARRGQRLRSRRGDGHARRPRGRRGRSRALPRRRPRRRRALPPHVRRDPRRHEGDRTMTAIVLPRPRRAQAPHRPDRPRDRARRGDGHRHAA